MSLFGSAAGAIAGGVLSAFGQGMANNANAALAIADRDFQREILQNRHQWETQDWQKAGFNRIMALNSSGGTGSPTAIAMQNPLAGLGEGVSSAVDKVQAEKQLKSLIKQRDYQNKNIEADTHYKYAGAYLADEQSKKFEAEVEQIRQAMPWIVQDFKNRASNSAKQGLVMDSQIAANIANASASYSAAQNYDEQRRGQKLDNDFMENLGDSGRTLVNLLDIAGLGDIGKLIGRFGKGVTSGSDSSGSDSSGSSSGDGSFYEFIEPYHNKFRNWLEK